MDKTVYFRQILNVIKKAENLKFAKGNKVKGFNNSEMRLLEEICMYKMRGERIISTQLAKNLGVTRSAISQMVNRLEERNIVCRVADKIDRKIAYIELTPEAEDAYERQKELVTNSISKVVEQLGTNKMDSFIAMANEVFDCINENTVEE